MPFHTVSQRVYIVNARLYDVIGTSLHRNRNTITQERLFQGVNGVKELGS